MELNMILVLLFMAKISAKNPCKNMIFKITKEGQVLKGFVFKTLQTQDEGHCRANCYMHDRCLSYNYISYGTMCELNESDHVMHPDNVIRKEGFVYQAAENSCNCSKKELCRFDFVNNSHRCECNLSDQKANCLVSSSLLSSSIATYKIQPSTSAVTTNLLSATSSMPMLTPKVSLTHSSTISLSTSSSTAQLPSTSDVTTNLPSSSSSMPMLTPGVSLAQSSTISTSTSSSTAQLPSTSAVTTNLPSTSSSMAMLTPKVSLTHSSTISSSPTSSMAQLASLSLSSSVLLSSTASTPTTDCKLVFPSASLSNYVLMKNAFTKTITEFTLSFWLRVHNSYSKIVMIFSYKTPASKYFALRINNDGSAWLYINSYKKSMHSNLVKGIWQHILITWKSSDGSVVLYRNGAQQYSIASMRRGQRIPSGGDMYLGRTHTGYHDRVLQGSIADLHIWHNAVNSDTAKKVSTWACQSSSKYRKGEILAWETILASPLKGSVRKKCPANCLS